ncbi:uncharacterized protein [Rutidosis leptorrhynchoides]|uniref:uncharacterized protein n=1 Tax=Rutidosis leptorrhynchoides TaxID=125765 RepID=UPI003A99E004
MQRLKLEQKLQLERRRPQKAKPTQVIAALSAHNPSQFPMKIMTLNIRGLGLDDRFKTRWFKNLCDREIPNLIALQETKCRKFPESWIEKIWGNDNYKYAVKNSKGNSGGILLVWDTRFFITNRVVERESFIAIKGKWLDAGTELIFINVYGPQTDEAKKKMWSDLNEVMNYDEAMWIILGDFNKVRFASERKNTVFVENRAAMFNKFIKDNELLEVPLGGRLYTRISDNGRKFSKLDSILISGNCLQQWPNLSASILDKKHTDHCPIVLTDGISDFGPKPIKFFDEWIKHKDTFDIVKRT